MISQKTWFHFVSECSRMGGFLVDQINRPKDLIDATGDQESPSERWLGLTIGISAFGDANMLICAGYCQSSMKTIERIVTNSVRIEVDNFVTTVE